MAVSCTLSQPVHETATYRCDDDTRGCVIQFWPPDDEHMCSKHVEAWNKLIVEQTFCASIWLITEINILRCTVSKSSKKIIALCCIGNWTKVNKWNHYMKWSIAVSTTNATKLYVKYKLLNDRIKRFLLRIVIIYCTYFVIKLII